MKESGELGRRCRCRTSPYLNNIIEQDHRFIKKRIVASLGFRSAEEAWRTLCAVRLMPQMGFAVRAVWSLKTAGSEA
jgi:transposase-like protein